MTSKWTDSVVLIKSSDINNKRFGTGFIIHEDSNYSYVLTCEHVIKDVGGNGNVFINKIKAEEVIARGKDGIDLSVVKVKRLSDKLPLKLSSCGKKGMSILIFGFQNLTLNSTNFLTRPLDGKLGNPIEIWGKDGIKLLNGWDLIIDEYLLQPGYSGSPVFDESKECVVGVVSHRIGDGEKGIAISIEMLKQVWSEMPYGLLNVNNQSGIEDKMTNEKGEIEKKIQITLQIEKIEKLFVNAEYKQAYEAFFRLCKSYPEFEGTAKSILSRYSDFCKGVEMGLIPLPEQHIRKQEIANSYQMCMNRFKKEQLIG
ncbi:MAG: trypsin-like peptidase domain-containing protein [Desulfamplus sp.]|nr:trypsin-like peptidase domain-containing protein [Desulfamplus sp.]